MGRTKLHPKNQPLVDLFPDIISDNIPNGAVNLAKLSNDIKTILANVQYKLDITAYTTSIGTLATAFDGFGISMSIDASNVFTIGSKDLTLDKSDYFDMTTHFVKYQHNGNHYFGRIQLEINEQIMADEYLFEITEQREYPLINTPLVAFKNGTLCTCIIDTDGLVQTKVGLDEYDVIDIILDWYI